MFPALWANYEKYAILLNKLGDFDIVFAATNLCLRNLAADGLAYFAVSKLLYFSE